MRCKGAVSPALCVRMEGYMYRNPLVRILMAGSLLSAAGCSSAQYGVNGPPLGVPAGITAMGQGEVSAEPELARITVGVEARSPTVAEAMAEAAQRSASINQTLRAMGVAEDDIKSAGFTLYPERPGYWPHPMGGPPMPMLPPSPPPTIAPPDTKPAAAAPDEGPSSSTPDPRQDAGQQGYRVMSGYEVTLRDLTRIGDVLQALTRAGANSVMGIACDVEDRSALAAKARTEAIADAKARAAQIAQASGVELGDVIGIADSQSEGFPPMLPMAAHMQAAAEGAAPVLPIQCDRVRLNYNVTINYELG